MIVVVALLLVPLGLRYLTSWHMRSLRAEMLRSDEETRQLRTRYVEVREQLIDARRRQRLFAVRRSHLLADIRTERQRLEELRAQPTRDRLAA